MAYFSAMVITLLLYWFWRNFTTEEERAIRHADELAGGCLAVSMIVLTVILMGLGLIVGTKENIMDMIQYYNKHYNLDIFLFAVIGVFVIEMLKKGKR